MALVAPIEMRVNVENQQSGHQEYGQYRRVRPVPFAHRQRMTVVDLPLDRVLFRLHWRIPSAAYQKSSLIARPPFAWFARSVRPAATRFTPGRLDHRLACGKNSICPPSTVG